MRSIFVACVFDPGSLCGSDREQTKIRTITLWYLLSVASACGAANCPIQVAACWRSQHSAQRHGLEDWDQSTDSLSGEERVARGLSVVLCQVVVWSSFYQSRRTRRGWSSGLQRLLIVIRVFFFSFPFLAFPTFLTTYTRDTFCLLPPFLTFASDPGHWVLSSTRFGRPSSQVHFGGVWLQLSLRSVRSVPFRADPGVVFLSFSDLLVR